MADAIAPNAPVQTTFGTPAEAKAPDAAPAAAPVETKAPEKDQFAEKLELLSRKERAIYREKMKVAQERKETQEAMAKLKQWEESKSNAKKNPLDYLTTAGLSYDELTQFMLNGGKPTEEDKIEVLRNELGQFKKQQEEEKKRQTEEQTKAQLQQQEQVLTDFQEEVSQFITENKDTYELISTRDAAEDVFTTIRDQFRESMQEWVKQGRRGPPPAPMSTKEAADIVEEFYEKEVERLAQTKKMQAKLQPVIPGKQDTKKGPAPTLTNQMTSSAASSLLPAKNEADRMARALAKLGS